MRKRKKLYKVVGAYDSETTNIYSPLGARAFPILHQIGIVEDVTRVDVDNVEDLTHITLFRHTYELCSYLDKYMEQPRDFIPVIMCHNLSFDMYPLGDWLSSHSVRVLAKSRQKPITFTFLDDSGNPSLVIWDTLVFSGQSLERMGLDCGYFKAVGAWDYEKIRTPETELSADEIEYAKRDIYTLICWLAWWLKRNPDIEPNKLGLNVVTKTGVVRERRKKLFDSVKGNGHKHNVGRYWNYHNKREQPKTDDELFTMHACTRGGFTFVAGRSASIPFELEGTPAHIAAYDAVSMHPSHMCAHRYPVGFKPASLDNLLLAFELIAKTDLEHVLEHFAKPFPVAFNALFEFTNLRLKKGSIFERFQIASLASARFSVPVMNEDDSEAGHNFKADIFNQGYHDIALNPVFTFGKLLSAENVALYLTELEAWVIAQVYEWDSIAPVGGYMTLRFNRPTDMSVLSVMRFFKVKNAFKSARKEYLNTGTLSRDKVKDCQDLGVAPVVLNEMIESRLSVDEADKYYQVYKSDLNALFGIECSNEYRQDTILTDSGITYEGQAGIENAPKNPKTWYQFGQRIVGWSRVAQTIALLFADGICDRVINGDTDSIKLLFADEIRRAEYEKQLERYAVAIDTAKRDTLTRVRLSYPAYYDALDDIGHYELEFTSQRFCAAWNKAYCIADNGYDFTLAGIPARRAHGLNEFAKRLSETRSFGEICDMLLGYNVTLAYNLTGLNARAFPKWGEMFNGCIDGVRVSEPAALALYPMAKTVNALEVVANRANHAQAVRNRPTINDEDIILTWSDEAPQIVKVVEDG